MKKINTKILSSFSILFFFLYHVTGQIKFEDVTEKAELIEPLKGMMGHGAAWGDINGDGFPDLFVGTFADRPDSIYNVRGHQTGPASDKLLLNNGDGTFKQVMNSPVEITGRNSGAAFADFDNDGDLDLVTSHQSFDNGNAYRRPNNFLFENDGKGSFKDITAKSNLNFGRPFAGRNTFVFDYDGDGMLDILMQEDFVLEISGANSRLMKNMGSMVFKDVTAEAGLPSGYQKGLYGLGGIAGDINGDLWPDIFFAHSCRMFINNKNGTFREKKYILVNSELTEPATTSPNWTCGADFGDIDNDGDMDLVIGDHLRAERSDHKIYLFLNDGNDSSGDPILKNITALAGIAETDGKAPHLQLQDIDNDGLIDIMVSNCTTFIFKNKGMVNGIPQFEKPIGSDIEGGIGYWASAPLGDYDRDGRLDFLGMEWEPSVASPLLRNISQGAQHYIDVMMNLEDSRNRNGIGAKVEIFQQGQLGNKEGHLGTRIISVSNGYSSGTEAIAHFGLPNTEEVDFRITMPAGGKVYEKKNVAANQLFILEH